MGGGGRGDKLFTSGSVCPFRRWVDEMEMIDLGFVSYLFTWNNRRAGRSNIRKG